MIKRSGQNRSGQCKLQADKWLGERAFVCGVVSCMFRSSLLLFGCFSVGAWAATRQPAVDFSPSRAEAELSVKKTPSKSASEAAVHDSGMLALKDPGLGTSVRLVMPKFAIGLERLVPRGTAKFATEQKYELSSASPILLPTFEAGIFVPAFKLASLGIGGLFGFGAQDADAEFRSGASVHDARLSAQVLEAYLRARIRMGLPWLSLEAAMGAGTTVYSFSAVETAASFTESVHYQLARLLALARLDNDWSFGLGFWQRQKRGPGTADMEPAGVKFLAELSF